MSNRSLKEKKHHDEMAKKNFGACWANDSIAGQARQDRKAMLAREYITMDENAKILEIGCGNGEFSKRFLSVKAQMFCVDISEESIAILQSKYKNTNITFAAADIEKLPYPDNCFDGVIGNGILHHLNLTPCLKEIYRVLKKGGKIFFSEPNIINPEVFLETKVHWIGKLAQKTDDETAFTRWGMKRELEKAGFTEVKVSTFDFLQPLTPAFLIPFVKKLGDILENTPLVKEIAGSIKIQGKK